MTQIHRWWTRPLFWVATFYPLYIAAQIWVRVLPAYVHSWLTGAEAGPLRMDALFISARARGGVGTELLFAGQTSAIVAAAIGVMLLGPLRKRMPDLAGRAAAMIGLTLCGNWIGGVLVRNAPPLRGAVPALVGLAFLTVGMRWAMAAIPGRYWGRLGVALAGMALPAAMLPMLLSNWNRSWFGGVTTVPAIALAALVQFRLTPVVTEVRLRSAGLGLLLSLFVFGALDQGREWQQRARETEVAKVLASLPKRREDDTFPKHYFHRGVNFTANGYGYESEQARSLLRRLPEFGVQSIAVVPYGGMDRRTLRMSPARPGTWESDAGVEIITATARGLGMKVMLKPHIWRPQGDQPLSEEDRAVWFQEYTAFIEHYARLAQRIHADTLCIGVEFGQLTEFEPQWRTIIATVRSLYKGPLVYAANHGREFESIRFWDALDYIGLDNYYPLPDDYSAAEIVKKVEEVAKRYDRPVLLTEAGYSSAVGSHKTPWADHPPSSLSLEEQVRCYEAIFAAFYEKPWFAGVYWWKIETDGAGGPADNSMVPWGKPAMQTMKKWYARPEALRVPAQGARGSTN
ncbi:MAG: hypothetical protein HY820_26705 [Acidobacteria bacterium]|nr:hypothetical protein [Acidobacteriota bacterium]